MLIELSKMARKDAVASLQRYFEENLPEPLGDLTAEMLLDYVLAEIGPTIYNRAIVDAQTRMQMRVADMSGELYVDEFQYWPKVEAKRKKR